QQLDKFFLCKPALALDQHVARPEHQSAKARKSNARESEKQSQSAQAPSWFRLDSFLTRRWIHRSTVNPLPLSFSMIRIEKAALCIPRELRRALRVFHLVLNREAVTSEVNPDPDIVVWLVRRTIK